MKHANAAALSVGAVLLVLSAALAEAMREKEQLEIARATQGRAAAIASELKSTLQERARAMERMASRLSYLGHSDEGFWRADATNYYAHMKGMHALSRADAETVTRWIEPVEGNEKALGFRMSEDEVRRVAIARARERRTNVLTSLTTLRSGQRGFLLISPVWRGAKFDGVVSAIFDAQKFVEAIISPWDYQIEITEGGQPLYRTPAAEPASASYQGEAVLRFQDVTWQVRVHPRAAALAYLHSPLPLRLFLGGALIALLAALLTRSYFRERRTRQEFWKTLQWQLSIVNGSDLLIISSGPDGVIESINPTACALLGYRADELIGKQTPAIWHDPAEVAARARVLSAELGRPIAPGYEVFVTKARLGLVDRNPWTFITREGRRVPVSLSVHALRGPGGEILGYVGIINDMTEKVRQEQELQAAVARSQAAVESRSRFLANMSHEIRTPINGVIGLAEVLRETELSPAQREYATNIQKCADILLALVNDVLDLSKIESGKLEIEDATYDLEDLVAGFGFLVRSASEKKGLAYREIISTDLPRYLRGDPARIRQILVNLLGNAVKFTDRGEVELRIERYERSDHGGHRIRFTVRDTGIGIPPARLERLFEDYAQAHASTTRRYGGTGLGLSISRRLAALMGGEVGVMSQEGQGSRFWLELPEVAGLPGQVDRPSCPFPAAAVRAPRRVLVAEDNAINQLVVTKLLEKLGHTFKVVGDGEAAVEALEREAFDLVLMDCLMPHLDGPEATRVLRQSLSPRVRQTPVIAVTANASEEDRAQCQAAGMQGYLAKPISGASLEAEIERVLASPSGRREAA